MTRSRRKRKPTRPGDGCWHCDTDARVREYNDLKHEIAAGVKEGLAPLAEAVPKIEEMMKAISAAAEKVREKRR